MLALQGAFREHRLALERLGAEVVEVRLPHHLEGLSGVVMPGGESTTIAKLLVSYGLDEALRSFASSGRGLWGTCAGAILLAKEVVGRPEQPRLGLLDISVTRNDYGRQVASFETELDVVGLSSPVRVPFIRAPRIVRVGEGVQVMARLEDEPVLVRQGRIWAGVFHPELSGDDRLHRLFLEAVSDG